MDAGTFSCEKVIDRFGRERSRWRLAIAGASVGADERVTVVRADLADPGWAAALPVPEGDEDEVEALLAAADEAIAQAEKDPASLLVLQGADTPFSEVNRLSTKYGLEVCGSAEES